MVVVVVAVMVKGYANVNAKLWQEKDMGNKTERELRGPVVQTLKEVFKRRPKNPQRQSKSVLCEPSTVTGQTQSNEESVEWKDASMKTECST